MGQRKWKLSTLANVLIKATATSVLLVVFAELKHHSRWSSAAGRARKFPR